MSITCSICGSSEFELHEVLWDELVEDWNLSGSQRDYINRQQGFSCKNCSSNMRSIALASAIMRRFGFGGTFSEFVSESPSISVLEINPAGSLTRYLERLADHTLISYPEYDMQNLNIESGLFDLVVHSDTLEHVPNVEDALSETLRVLRPRGVACFTIPIIYDRLTKSRAGLKASYHKNPDTGVDEHARVYFEFGADFWSKVLMSGFRSVEVYAAEFPAGLAVVASRD